MELLQAFQKVNENDWLKFCELPEKLSRGIYDVKEKLQTFQWFNRKSGINFNAEDTHLGLVYEFTFKCSLSSGQNSILIAKFHSIHNKVWEMRLNQIDVFNQGVMTKDVLADYPDLVLFLIHSALDILKMTCFFSSLHKKYTVSTLTEKRYIVFQYDKNTKSDIPIQIFLLNKCQWKPKDKEIKIGVVKNGSPMYAIPSQYYTLQ